MKIGDSKVDFEGLLIDGPGGHQSMEPKVMKLLRVLVDNAGQVMTREGLIIAVWGVEYGGDERLSRAISILRKALGDKRGQHTHIVTISRVGYRLIAHVNQSDSVASQSVASHIAVVETVTPLSTAKSIPVPAETMPAHLPKARALPVKVMGVFAAVIMSCVVIGFFVLLNARTNTVTKETISLQAKMERGFSHIENFTPQGAISEAQDIFSGILSENPNHAAARAGLAFSVMREYTHLERDPALLQRAKAHAEAALREDEHLALANVAVAWAAVFEGNFDRAHKHLDKADILDADNVLAMEGRYGAFSAQGHVERALEVINAGITIYPDNALFYDYRGNYFMNKEDYAAAERNFRQAIALSPDNSRTYAQLAHSLYLQSRTDEAVNVIQNGLRVNETALLYNNLGTYLFFQGQYDLASSAFEKTLESSGDTHNYLYWANLGDAYRWSKNNVDEAATAYRRALQLLQIELNRYPDDTNLKSRAAMFNAKLGNLDEAQFHIDSFTLTLDAPSIQLYRAVVTYEIMSNRSKALEYLEAAIMSDYPLIEILNDPELALLRQDPAYHKLLAKSEK